MSNNTVNILPDLIEYAISKDLKSDPKNTNPDEIPFECIWCGDNASKGKYKLSLNRIKGTYNCWVCKQTGGTIDFIMAVEEKSKQEVVEELREIAGLSTKERKERHPAQNLSSAQLKLIGFKPLGSNLKVKASFKKRVLDWQWTEWNNFLDYKRKCALQILMLCIKCDMFYKAVPQINKMSKEIGYDLLPEVFDAYGAGDNPPKWAENSSEWVEAVYEAYYKHEIKNTSIRSINEAVAL